jgi:hypothetical protein
MRRPRSGYSSDMSLFSSAVRFARSPQGKRAIAQAKKLASDPKNKQKLEELRRRVAAGKRPR